MGFAVKFYVLDALADAI